MGALDGARISKLLTSFYSFIICMVTLTEYVRPPFYPFSVVCMDRMTWGETAYFS